MKLRSVIFLSSLIVVSCVTGKKSKPGGAKQPQAKIKMSMASNINELPLNGTPPQWALTGRCNSSYNIEMNQDNTFARKGDMCEVKLMTFSMPTKVRDDQGNLGNEVTQNFRRHLTENDFDKETHAAIFQNDANTIWVYVRLVSGINKTPISETSEISYQLTEIKQGKDLDVELRKFPLRQISVSSVESPRFKVEGIFDERFNGDLIEGRYDVRCLNSDEFKVNDPSSTETVNNLKNFGTKISAARNKLKTLSELLSKATTQNSVSISDSISDIQNDLTQLIQEVTQPTAPTVQENAATPTILAANNNDPFCVFNQNTQHDKYYSMTKCLDKIGNKVSTEATSLGLDKWSCGTNALSNLRYRVARDNYSSAHGQLTRVDLDHLMAAYEESTDEQTIDPKHHTNVWQINESVTGFKTPIMQLPMTQHGHSAPTKAIFVIKATKQGSTADIDSSFSFYSLTIKP